MIILFGLGNPGKEYQNTRHNVGQMFLDFLVKKWGLGWKKRKDYLALVAKKNNWFLVKPKVFMNESGKAVKIFLTAGPGKCFKRGNKICLIVVHDELDLPLGKWKLTFAKSSPLHKGIISIESYLKTKKFWRLRIGVDNRQSNDWLPGEKYVLQNFQREEKEILTKVFAEIAQNAKFLSCD